MESPIRTVDISQGSLSHTKSRAGASDASPTLEVTYSGRDSAWSVRTIADEIRGLVEPWDGRQRVFLTGLINGLSRKHAAAAAGVSVRTTQLWAKKHSSFRDAARHCEEIGFATVLESELYRRAMAGASDTGSIRALELVMRSRAAEYREPKCHRCGADVRAY